jgi:RluA family pseudouridine synthase
MSDPFTILYEEGPVLAVLKPAGVATQAPAPFDCMEVRVREWYREREGKSGNIYLGVPHRLDRPVSGVLLFARHVRAAQRISRQFEERRIEKVYWACTTGEVTPPEGTWVDHIKKVYGRPQAEIVPADDPLGREAILRYRTLGRTPYGSFLEIELVTGRTHQVRVQAAHRGWPILGDAFYGSQIPFGSQAVDERERAIGLHGRRIALVHPMTHRPIAVTAPLSEAWSGMTPPEIVDQGG